ncbi:Isoleucine--tRNA ligase, cytoplasmic, partial [Fragariocoptes setiger]
MAEKVCSMESVRESIDFNEAELTIVDLWKKTDAFKTSVRQSVGKPKFNFYDGPPFATGMPHYGHILTGTIKDVVTRYAHQSGFHVERRFGWDCHGLPVEYEIDKMLGIRGPEDVAKMGIKAYNDACRKIVMRYSSEWRNIITRMGRWIDFDNDYKTMYPEFMESVWWVFKQLFDKGLVYRGSKVMPYSTACATPLSNFESGQNYKDVSDPAVVVTFPILDSSKATNRFLLAWTTTPWTLPSNLALCCNDELDYVEVRASDTGNNYILLESSLSNVMKKVKYEIVKKFKGSEIAGLEYEPLFDYFIEFRATNGFRVLTDSYVTEGVGTGIVHQAPYFGEDDQRVCLANGIIRKDGKMVCPLDAKGCFVDQVTDFKGLHVKEADKNIIKHLKQKGRMFSDATINHSYPFCWRSDTPLIYRAVPSWFIRVEPMVNDLLKANQDTYWVPDYVKQKRFANWLENARDWAVSRNRYWGTPIPIWSSDDGEEIFCVGSIEELERLTGASNIADLHRESIDHLTIPSTKGRGQLKRIPEVFDCWFESGSMPYAQQHYPFKSREDFEKNFPAEFIAEGIDQTRGWFYTLLVVSTCLFNKPPFKNLIVNGLVLASDGHKMSKSKKNYPDPMSVVEKYGADALRLYLITSPAVRAENLKFREDGVKEILKEVILPWYNAYRFFTQNLQMYELETKSKFRIALGSPFSSDNIMDKWINSFTQSLVKFVGAEMKRYHLYTVVPRLVKFVGNLTNWYVRMNRRRLKGEGGPDDHKAALSTLCHVLNTMVRLMAPFTPFITELIYQNLRNLIDYKNDQEKRDTESVHYLMIPTPIEEQIDSSIERQVATMQTVIELGRVVRDRCTLPLKQPLSEIIVISCDENVIEDVKLLQSYILSELNIRTLITTTDKKKYGVQIKADPDIKKIGSRLRAESKALIEAIRKLSELDISKYQEDPENFTLQGHRIESGEIQLVYNFDQQGAGNQKYEAHSDGKVVVLLNICPDKNMLNEGYAREFINRIQKLRKKAHLSPTDPIKIYYAVNGPEAAELFQIVDLNKDLIDSTLKSELIRVDGKLSEHYEKEIARDNEPLKNFALEISIVRLS